MADLSIFGKIMVFTFLQVAFCYAAPPSSAGSSGMGNMGTMNFNLSTPQGIQQFLQMENINPSQIVTSNCIANGKPCSTSGGKPCCLSPVFSCLPLGAKTGTPSSTSSSPVCQVIPAHVNHIPQIQQIVKTAGVTTTNPIF